MVSPLPLWSQGNRFRIEARASHGLNLNQRPGGALPFSYEYAGTPSQPHTLEISWLGPGRYPYFIFASRRSVVRRSSYSSLVISPAAYLLCRSCRGDCICR